jgi:hypothetical protein
MKCETIVIYNFDTNEEAPKRQANLMFEYVSHNTSLNSNPAMGLSHLQIPSAELVDAFLCENIGFLFINGLKKRSHYEVPVSYFSHYEAKHQGVNYVSNKANHCPPSSTRTPTNLFYIMALITTI